MSTSKETTPWCEKYRPVNMESIVLDPFNKTIFHNIIEKNTFPHLLFYGPPGVGKTTTADNLVNDYQRRTSKLNRETIIHLNASDERGYLNGMAPIVKCYVNGGIRKMSYCAE